MTPEEREMRYGGSRSGRHPNWSAASMAEQKRRAEMISSVQPFLERIRANFEELLKKQQPQIAMPRPLEPSVQSFIMNDTKPVTQIAGPPNGIPIAKQLGGGNAQQAIPVAQHAPQGIPIAGPAPSLPSASGGIAGGAGFGGASAPQVGGTPSFGRGVAGAMGLAPQSGALLSGGGAGGAGGNQDLLSAITELIEAVKDLTEKLGDESNKQKEPHTPSVGSGGKSASGAKGGKDIISTLAQNASGIEWANQMERWFASRFGRRS